MFKCDPKANANGTSLQGYVEVAPALLISALGEAPQSDGYKSSGEYRFINTDTGEVFTLYDWKSTNLYSSGFVSPRQFWANEKPYEFHVGAHSDKNVALFIEWVECLRELAKLI